jgi:T4 RnlA family RNA ligase
MLSTWVNETNFRKVLGGLNQVRFTEEHVDSSLFTICSYMVADPEIWKTAEGMEARGIVFDEFGEVVCRPFEKFFNLNEREDTQEHLIKEQFGKPGTRLFEKRDGSMLTPVMVDGRAVFKTKKSFFSDVAKIARAHAETIPGFLEACEDMLCWGMTPIFEFTSPSTPIVVDYGDKPQFTLLAIRDMFNGAYVYPEDGMNEASYWERFKMVEWIKEYKFLPTWKDLRDAQASYEGIEGWIIVLPDGKRVKLKTDWYMSRHRLLDIRPRDIAVAVVEEQYDDLYSAAVDRGISDVQFVDTHASVMNDFKTMWTEVHEIVEDVYELIGKPYKDQGNGLFWIPDETELRAYWKDAAELAKKLDPKLCAHAMTVIRGKEVDYKKWWYKDYHQKYGLRSIFNSNFGKDIDN